MRHDRDHLRPRERAVLLHTDEGLSSQDIAWRLRRSPRYIDRLLRISSIPRSGPYQRYRGGLRPIERHVLKALESGFDYPEIAARFRRTPVWVQRVEDFANYKLAIKEWRDSGADRPLPAFEPSVL